MNLRSRVEQLEKHTGGPSILLLRDDEPQLAEKVRQAERQGKTVIVLSCVDAAL